METLNELISFQASGIKLSKFENEFLTIRIVHGRPESVKALLRLQTLDWLKSLGRDTESDTELNLKSSSFRELGNKTYRQAPKQNALEACRYYTQAIFCAPLGQTLALAHANRALALQKFGYFQQAYDDCECALEQGYPEKLRHKLWSRQAFCALQLGDAAGLKKHLDVLVKYCQLNGELSKVIEELKKGLTELQSSYQYTSEGKPEDTQVEQHHKTQILKNSLRGRYMIVTKPVVEGELIFSERAISFVPVNGKLLCQECGATQIIPFPCPRCHGKVVYCSLECRHAHQSAHVYECTAYQKNLFDHVGIAHLAFRLVIDHAPQIAQTIQKCDKPSAFELWRKLTTQGDASEGHLRSNQYTQTLNLITHLDKMPLRDVLWFALVSRMLVLYLREFTDFFCIFSKLKISFDDLELLIGSLLLRHIGQLIVNGHSCISLCRKRESTCSDSCDFDLIVDKLWISPWHIRRGFLHKFCHFEEVSAANFPYLSMCNHACEQTFEIKYSGRFIDTFAFKPLKAGDEIFDCYTIDYRKSRKSIRWNHLKEIYYFQCECVQCSKPNVDEDYEQFNRYRCDRPECQQVFTLNLQQHDNWWELMGDVNATKHIVECSICHKPQNCQKRHDKYTALLKGIKNRTTRHELYAYFNYIGTFLVDYNRLKLFYALQVVMKCFDAHIAGPHLEDCEFPILNKILKFYLRGVAAQSSKNSIEYVSNMTYLWDLIALGKYKPSQDEVNEMLRGIEMISDEMQKLMRNYYNDYIAHNFN